MNTDLAHEMVKAAPPLVVTGITIGGLELSAWVQVLTIAYIIMQMAFLLFKAGRLRGRQDRDE